MEHEIDICNVNGSVVFEDLLRRTGASEERVTFYCSQVRKYTLSPTYLGLSETPPRLLTVPEPSLLACVDHTLARFPNLRRLEVTGDEGIVVIIRDPTTSRILEVQIGPTDYAAYIKPADPPLADVFAAELSNYGDFPITQMHLTLLNLVERLEGDTDYLRDHLFSPSVSYTDLTTLILRGEVFGDVLIATLASVPALTHLIIDDYLSESLGEVGIFDDIGKACPLLKEFQYVTITPGPAFTLSELQKLHNRCPDLTTVRLSIYFISERVIPGYDAKNTLCPQQLKHLSIAFPFANFYPSCIATAKLFEGFAPAADLRAS